MHCIRRKSLYRISPLVLWAEKDQERIRRQPKRRGPKFGDYPGAHLPDQQLRASSTSIGQQTGAKIFKADLVAQNVLVHGIVDSIGRAGQLVAGRVGHADVQAFGRVILGEQH